MTSIVHHAGTGTFSLRCFKQCLHCCVHSMSFHRAFHSSHHTNYWETSCWCHESGDPNLSQSMHLWQSLCVVGPLR